MLSRPAFAVLVFVLGWVVFNWPFLGALAEANGNLMIPVFRVIALWGLLVAVLAAMGRACRDRDVDSDQGNS
jgi:uncharacterized membrane protein